MLDFIEKVVYINLEYRTDRKECIEKELSIFPSEKVIRFNAIREKYGYIGCTKSHIGCLELAKQNNWENVLIVEDDMVWKNLNNNIPLIKRLASQPYDVIIFGGGQIIYDKNTYKLGSCTLAHCYLVSNHYYQPLIDNLNEGLKLLLEDMTCSKYANDQYWKHLQKKDNWYIIQPPVAIQKITYSDNERRIAVFSNSIGQVYNDKLEFDDNFQLKKRKIRVGFGNMGGIKFNPIPLPKLVDNFHANQDPPKITKNYGPARCRIK